MLLGEITGRSEIEKIREKERERKHAINPNLPQHLDRSYCIYMFSSCVKQLGCIRFDCVT